VDGEIDCAEDVYRWRWKEGTESGCWGDFIVFHS